VQCAYLQSSEKDQFTLSIGSETLDSVEINLRSSCLACRYISFCPVADESASPDADWRVGRYTFRSLKTMCLQ
jgi:hypothetical protein